MTWLKLAVAVSALGACFAQAPALERAESLLDAARASGDPAKLTEAQASLTEALRLAPDDFRAQKAQARLLLQKQDYGPALDLAKVLNRRMPDDLEVYGFLVEAYRRAGNLAEAEKAAQWMLDLRQEHPLSLWRAADVREDLGQLDGALHFLNEAYRRIHSADNLQRGLILAQIARLHAKTGRRDRAEAIAREAVRLLPEAPQARQSLAFVLETQP